jgi:hypothetical protein
MIPGTGGCDIMDTVCAFFDAVALVKFLKKIIGKS